MLLYTCDNNKESAVNSSMNARREYLRGMIMKKIIMKLAEEMKIDTIPALKNAFSGRLFALAKKTLNNDSITNKFISEQLIQNEYNNDNYVYRPFHILLRNNSKESAKRIQSFYTQIDGCSDNFIKIS